MDTDNFDEAGCENDGEIKADSFNVVLSRIQMVTGRSTQVDLGEYLGIRQSSISDGKRRNKVPGGWLLTLLYKQWVNPIWVLTGEGGMFVAPVDESPCCPSYEEQHRLKKRIDAFSTDELVAELLRRSLIYMRDYDDTDPADKTTETASETA